MHCSQQETQVADCGQMMNSTGDLCCRDKSANDAKITDVKVNGIQVPHHVFRRSKRGTKVGNKISRLFQNLFPSSSKSKTKQSNQNPQNDARGHQTDHRYDNGGYPRRHDYQDRNSQRSDWRQSYQVHEDGRGQWLRDYTRKKQGSIKKEENESDGKGEWLRNYLKQKKNEKKR